MAITPLPTPPAPTDSPQDFNTKAFDLLNALPDFVTEANAQAVQVDADASAAAVSAGESAGFATDAETAANASIGAANFKGEWSTLTGALNIPASVSHNGSIWVLTESLADVTSNEPGVDSPNFWLLVTLPAAGDAGNVLTSDGTNWTSAAGASAEIQDFTTSGTWTKPSNANFVMVEAWGGGGGGGSGRRGAAGGARTGGGGGSGASYVQRLFSASELPSTVLVTAGAAGSGGAAITANATNGNAGSAGGNSSFGGLLTSYGGLGGLGGSSSDVNAVRGSGVLGGVEPESYINSSGATVGGQFGGGAAVGTTSFPSGFGGGAGGAANTTIGGQGASSYQGGAGGGGGGPISTANNLFESGSSGGISGARGTGAGRVLFPGGAGINGVGRQGGSGGGGGRLSTAGVANKQTAFGSSTFAVATQNGIFTSSNGTNNWQIQTPPEGNIQTTRILHDGTQFVVFNGDATRCWTTTDFITYVEKTGIPAGASISHVKYVNSRYFAMGSVLFFAAQPILYTSTDLVTWTLINTGNGRSINDICFSGTNYVTVNDTTAPHIRISSDLITWSTPTGTLLGANACDSNGSGTVVIGSTESPFAQRSTDHGASFSNVATTLNGSVGAVNYLNSTWFIASSGGFIYSSTDGNSWTTRASSGDAASGGFAYDGTTVVAGSATPNTTAARTTTFANLSSWTDRSLDGVNGPGGAGGTGGTPGGGGGGGGASENGHNSGAGGNGGNGLVRVYTW
jgi:hypothetical protein